LAGGLVGREEEWKGRGVEGKGRWMLGCSKER